MFGRCLTLLLIAAACMSEAAVADVRISPAFEPELELAWGSTGEFALNSTVEGFDADANLDTLALRISGGDRRFWLGKTTPGFGMAWDRIPDVGAETFASDYELAGRWVVGGGFDFEALGARPHRLALEAFFVDTSLLGSEVLGSGRAPARADGGPGNTERPDSFVVTLAGNSHSDATGFDYRLSLLRQAEGRGDTGREIGIALGVERPFETPGGLVAPFMEWVGVEHPAGGPGKAHHATAGVSLEAGPWQTSAAVSMRKHSRSQRGAQLLVSLARRFRTHLRLSIGGQLTREPSGNEAFLGIAASWDFELPGPT